MCGNTKNEWGGLREAFTLEVFFSHKPIFPMCHPPFFPYSTGSFWRFTLARCCRTQPSFEFVPQAPPRVCRLAAPTVDACLNEVARGLGGVHWGLGEELGGVVGGGVGERVKRGGLGGRGQGGGGGGG